MHKIYFIKSKNRKILLQRKVDWFKELNFMSNVIKLFASKCYCRSTNTNKSIAISQFFATFAN